MICGSRSFVLLRLFLPVFWFEIGKCIEINVSFLFVPQWKQGYAFLRSGIQLLNLEIFHTHPFSFRPILSETTIGPAVSVSCQTNLLGLFRGYPGPFHSGLDPVTCSCQVFLSAFSLGARLSTARFWCYGTRLYVSQLVLREHGTNCLLCSPSVLAVALPGFGAMVLSCTCHSWCSGNTAPTVICALSRP